MNGEWPSLALRFACRHICGAVAQLGERQNRTLEVVGSNPISSTRKTAIGPRRLPSAEGLLLFDFSGRARRGSSGAL